MTAELKSSVGQGHTPSGSGEKVQQPDPPNRTVCVVASIDNHAHLSDVYGSALALTVRHIVHERANRLCNGAGDLVCVSENRLLLILEIAHLGPHEVPSLQQEGPLLERIITTLGNDPIESCDGLIFPVISARVVPLDDSPFDLDGQADASTQTTQAWRRQYATDMARTQDIFTALESGHLHLQYEPVCDVRNAANVLYDEALLRKMVDGKWQSASEFFPALERLGLVRRIDQWVVASVIETLRINRVARLGCNVSARSAVIDGWWASILSALAECPSMAARLTIEITETAPLHDLESAKYFVRTLQSLGCQIALDDIGAGHSSAETLIALCPDVAKIDRAYIRRARSDERGRNRLTQLIGFAGSCASHVVVEGIETDEDLRAARLSGATWVQGYRFCRTEPDKASSSNECKRDF
ncbi:EAL domain-containing protein [Trinickia mobilis]|uniref:EAL domain-containing protein n=1 Tax=Trinickia mobilis TaxID=2816356 RepID=UPI001A8F7F66|nr:EAL domain-containing protein [Trinickia mobilis]